MVVEYDHVCGPSKRAEVQNPIHGLDVQASGIISCEKLGEVSPANIFAQLVLRDRLVRNGIPAWESGRATRRPDRLQPVSSWTTAGEMVGQRVGAQVLILEE